jgi:hypothetical protein
VYLWFRYKIVQVPAPKLAVELGVCVVHIDGRRVLADELCGGDVDDVVAGAQERRHGHLRSVRVDDSTVPNAYIFHCSVTYRLIR